MDALSLVTLMLGLLDRASAIGQLIATARRENRDVTSAELDALVDADQIARAALVAAIAASKAGAGAAPMAPTPIVVPVVVLGTPTSPAIGAVLLNR